MVARCTKVVTDMFLLLRFVLHSDITCGMESTSTGHCVQRAQDACGRLYILVSALVKSEQ